MDPGDDMIFRVQLPSGEIHDLPHARTVSAWVHDGNDTKAAQATLLLMQVWGSLQGLGQDNPVSRQ